MGKWRIRKVRNAWVLFRPDGSVAHVRLTHDGAIRSLGVRLRAEATRENMRAMPQA